MSWKSMRLLACADCEAFADCEIKRIVPDPNTACPQGRFTAAQQSSEADTDTHGSSEPTRNARVFSPTPERLTACVGFLKGCLACKDTFEYRPIQPEPSPCPVWPEMPADPDEAVKVQVKRQAYRWIVAQVGVAEPMCKGVGGCLNGYMEALLACRCPKQK